MSIAEFKVQAPQAKADSNVERPKRPESKLPPAPGGPLGQMLAPLPVEDRTRMIQFAANNIARDLAAELVHNEVAKSGKSLRQIQQETGLDPAVISRVATGFHSTGPDLSTLAKIALALGKTIAVTFEEADDDGG